MQRTGTADRSQPAVFTRTRAAVHKHEHSDGVLAIGNETPTEYYASPPKRRSHAVFQTTTERVNYASWRFLKVAAGQRHPHVMLAVILQAD